MKLSKIRTGHTRLIHGHLMSRNEQPPTYRNVACGDQKLTIKYCLQDCPQWRHSRKKYGVQGDIGELLGKNCEVEKMMRFLMETEMYEE